MADPVDIDLGFFDEDCINYCLFWYNNIIFLVQIFCPLFLAHYRMLPFQSTKENNILNQIPSGLKLYHNIFSMFFEWIMLRDTVGEPLLLAWRWDDFTQCKHILIDNCWPVFTFHLGYHLLLEVS